MFDGVRLTLGTAVSTEPESATKVISLLPSTSTLSSRDKRSREILLGDVLDVRIISEMLNDLFADDSAPA